MMNYIKFFIRGNDIYYPIYTAECDSKILKLWYGYVAQNSGLTPINIELLTKIKDNINQYIKLNKIEIKKNRLCINDIINMNNNIDDKINKSKECYDNIQHIKEDNKELLEALCHINFLINTLKEQIDDESFNNINYHKYLYAGIDIRILKDINQFNAEEYLKYHSF